LGGYTELFTDFLTPTKSLCIWELPGSPLNSWLVKGSPSIPRIASGEANVYV